MLVFYSLCGFDLWTSISVFLRRCTDGITCGEVGARDRLGSAGIQRNVRIRKWSFNGESEEDEGEETAKRKIYWRSRDNKQTSCLLLTFYLSSVPWTKRILRQIFHESHEANVCSFQRQREVLFLVNGNLCNIWGDNSTHEINKMWNSCFVD